MSTHHNELVKQHNVKPAELFELAVYRQSDGFIRHDLSSFNNPVRTCLKDKNEAEQVVYQREPGVLVYGYNKEKEERRGSRFVLVTERLIALNSLPLDTSKEEAGI